MNAEDFITELSNLKAVLVLEDNVDMPRFNRLYKTAQELMFQDERVNKELMEEFFYFRSLTEI